MADTSKQTMYGLDTSKYPARMGKAWGDEEVIKLLKSIQKKKPINEIATEHERTLGGINSKRRDIAANYWFNDKRPMEEIQKYTGLTKEEIEDTIKRRIARNKNKPPVKPIEKGVKPIENAPTEIAELQNEIAIIKKDVQEILRLMNALYEFESGD